MIRLRSSGSFDNTNRFLNYASKEKMFDDLNRYGEKGVLALKGATPVDTGETSISWRYKIVRRRGKWHVEWYNIHVVDGVNIAVIIQYGHATRSGTYVEGINYINPAMKPIFEAMDKNVWGKVRNA